jgi:hypothetical protein
MSSRLQQFQQDLQRAVLATRPIPLPELCGDERANIAERLEIYRHGYRIRLREALAIEFPGLRLLAGRRFQSLLESYIETHPSHHYNIRWHGAGLAAFLECTSPWRERPPLAELARLDWAISTVFDAADADALAAADLAGIPADAWPQLRLRPLDHLQIVSADCNAEAFRRAADRGARRPHLRRYARLRHLLVWRQALEVRYRPIADDERAVLDGAMQGEPFAQLCERVAAWHASAQAVPRMAALLHQWLDAGLIGSVRLD